MKIKASCFITNDYGRDYKDIVITEAELIEIIKEKFQNQYFGEISKVSIDSVEL